MTTTDLAQLLKGRLEELQLSYRAAAERSRGMISHGTISAIVNGKHGGKISEQTIDGLVLALGLSRTAIERAAGIYRERPAEPFRLPEELNRLNRKERALLIELGNALLAAREEGSRGATGLGATGEPEAPLELPPDDVESVVIERPGKPSFAVARPRALGPMSEHERAQHISRFEQFEEQLRREELQQWGNEGP